MSKNKRGKIARKKMIAFLFIFSPGRVKRKNAKKGQDGGDEGEDSD